MDRERATYAVRLMMACGEYFRFPLSERLLILKRVMAQVVGLPTLADCREIAAAMGEHRRLP